MYIDHIDDVWPHVEHKDEIIRIDKDGYIVLDYVFQCDTTFDSPHALECRGIKFNSEGYIIARPFRKFFNFGEQGTLLPIEQDHVVLEKLDGSMVHPAMVMGQLVLMTRKGRTDVAVKAEKHFLLRPAYYMFMHEMLSEGYTPIFEFIGPDNRILLRYDEPRLVLIAIRHTLTGELMSYNDMVITALGKVDVVENIDMVNDGDARPIKDVDTFVDHAKNLIDAEGYVVTFDDGHMVKVKALDYVTKHRALDDLSSKKKVVALCVQGFADDLMPLLDEGDKQELARFNQNLNILAGQYTDIAEQLAAEYELVRKHFALTIAPKINPAWLVGVIFGIMDGKSARQLVLQNMQKHWNTLGASWRGQ
jgi:RNA ligase